MTGSSQTEQLFHYTYQISRIQVGTFDRRN